MKSVSIINEKGELLIFNIVKFLWQNKILVVKLAFALTFAIVLLSSFKTKMFTSHLKFINTSSETSVGGNLSSLIALGGFNLGSENSQGGLPIKMYEEIINGDQFRDSIKNAVVLFEDGHSEVLIDYLISKNKGFSLTGLFNKSEKKEKFGLEFYRSKEDVLIEEELKNNLTLRLDEEKSLIEISYTFDDPLGASTILKSVFNILTNQINEFRSSNISRRVDYLKGVISQYEIEYNLARENLATLLDSNTSLISNISKMRIDEENRSLILKQDLIWELKKELESQKVSLIEETSEFRVIVNSKAPERPDNYGLISLILISSIVSLLISSTFILLREIFKELK